MPPDAITLIYAAANGISLSRPAARSLALDMGITMNPMIMYAGRGIKNNIGIKPIVTRMTNDAIDTGIVSRAIKSIIET